LGDAVAAEAERREAGAQFLRQPAQADELLLHAWLKRGV